MKRALREGSWAIVPGVPISAPTEFQRQRLTEAVSAARLYLEGPLKTEEMATGLGRTPERAAQLVRLGIETMQQAGWLKPAGNPSGQAPTPTLSPSQPLCDRGRR